MNIDYERLTAAIMLGVRDGLVLVKEKEIDQRIEELEAWQRCAFEEMTDVQLSAVASRHQCWLQNRGKVQP